MIHYIGIAEWSTENYFTIVGAMLLDRKGTPAEIKKLDGCGEESTLYAHQKGGGATLLSYVDKSKSGKENDVVLSTIHTGLRVIKDERKTPNVHAFYDHRKSGVHVVDLVSSHSTTKMKVKQSPVNVLSFLLDTVRMNAEAIYLS